MITAQEKIQVLSLPINDPQSRDKLYEILFRYIGKVQSADQDIFSSYQSPRFYFLTQQLTSVIESQNSTFFMSEVKVDLNIIAGKIDKILKDIFVNYKKRLTRENKFRDSEAVNLLNALEIELELLYPKIKGDYERLHPPSESEVLSQSQKNTINKLIQSAIDLTGVDRSLEPRKKITVAKHLEKALEKLEEEETIQAELEGDRLSTEEKMAIVERLLGCAKTDEPPPTDEEVDQILFEGLMEKYK